jgi:hypothetical protein
MTMNHVPLESPGSERAFTVPVRAHRYEIELDVELTVGDQRVQAQTRTLSLGGAFVVSALRPPFGTRVALTLHVPYRQQPITASGVVRWSDARGFGMQFDGLRAHDVWVLGKFFEQAAPEAH